MKTLLLLLLVYANMGFTYADDSIHKPNPSSLIQSASQSRPDNIIVVSPDACRVVMD
jgi:hypothetical protein